MQVENKLKGHFGKITGLAFSEVLNVLVSSGADAQASIFSFITFISRITISFLKLVFGTSCCLM